VSENFKIPYGITIDRAVDLMVAEANRTGSEIRGEFNGQLLVANPGMDPKAITAPYWEQSRLNAIQQEVKAIEQRRRAECFPALIAACEELESVIDAQTYDAIKAHHYDAPDDAEFTVTLTAKQLRSLTKAINKAGAPQ